MGRQLFALLFASTLLVACDSDKAGTGNAAQADNGLPKPDAVSGSVTGMPNPGTASAPPQRTRAPDIVALPDEADADAGELVAGDAGLPPPLEAVQPSVIPEQPEAGIAVDLPPAEAAPVDAAGAPEQNPPRQ